MAANKEDYESDDFVPDEEDLQLALSVLAGSDPENCSYSRGYVKRQAVFVCNTCTPNAEDPAGICLACANKCHDGHDVIELYTKRNFRCDCGNKKFQDFQCTLNADKDEENVRNLYDHNFNGRYCTCDRPYPDTEEPENDNDEMIQCVVCEDWFHSRHLGCSVVEPEELQEMVCEACMNKAPFLWMYAAHFAVPSAINVSHADKDEEEDVVVVEANVEGEEDKNVSAQPSRSGDDEPSTSTEQTKQETANRSSPCKRTHEQMTGSPGKATTKTVACRLKELQAQGLERPRQGAVFWPYSWRAELCTCTSCKRAYVAAEVQFLMDHSDTILAYENKGLEAPFGQHPLMALTSKMDHVAQLEVIYGFNEMTTSISAFLDQCAAEGKIVTVEAVHQLFEELRARKRRRTNAGYQ